VLLLHGTLSSARQLDRLAHSLAEPGDVTVHALDRRGSGSSRLAVPRPLDVATHVDDVRAYLDARAIEQADIAGMSFGGVLALELAARLPGRVRSVVAYEPPYGPVADPETLAWFRDLAADTARAHAERGPAGAAETFLRAVAGDAAWDRLAPRGRTFLEAEGDGALADAGLTGLDPDGLGRIACPACILTGSASEAFYAPIADALAARIPGARRDTLEGLTHPSPITQPGIVAAAIRACLEPSS
jgi:pimeloyl-ACP methyl ester carboxylesterase